MRIHILGIVLVLIFVSQTAEAKINEALNNVSDSTVENLMQELELECKQVYNTYFNEINKVENALLQTGKLYKSKPEISDKLNLLFLKDSLITEIRYLRKTEMNDISKLRYQKGLQIIKILYEKILSLDHHFAAVRTFNEISNLSNPNHYPDFLKAKQSMQKQTDKKKQFDLGAILDKNIVTSVVYSFINILNSPAPKDEKENDLKNIECIIDFTLQMHQDLKTIFYETSFLQQSNESLKADIEQLFKDYTKPIKYDSSLSLCRTNDDWDRVAELLEKYMLNLKQCIALKETDTKIYKLQVNLEFPIDRLLQFIGSYNNFISQGEKYYEKFKVVLNSYQNKQQCASVIPPEYIKLKDDIDVAISKFKTAYKPVEVNGSKLKELLYGVNEFD